MTTSTIRPETRPPLVLTYDAAAAHLTWPGAIGALRRGHGLARPDLGDLRLGPRAATLLNRAAYIEGLGFAVKAETILPGNAARNLPSIQGSVLLYDADTGSIRAVIESRIVTEYKTAADSVLGASLLARPDSRHLLILGAGVVAASLVRAYAAMFPGLERISIWARRPDRASCLIAALGKVGVDLVVAEDLERGVGNADIVSGATMALRPILFGDWVRPGTHVDLVGGFTPDMREGDDALIARAQLFVLVVMLHRTSSAPIGTRSDRPLARPRTSAGIRWTK